MRLRYILPYSTEAEITRNKDKKKVELKISGNSGNFIFANGIGIGYNSSQKKGNLEDVNYKFKNNSLDLSYTIGRTLSFSLGGGKLIKGKGELTYNGKNYITETSIGESYFIDLGILFFLGEFIIRFRL